ncbi:hypothetical protein MLD38_015869 [Melastoma candidum]|uniref:Uncharacterized protein n=1 Tax=Melastoma candidum TaxID=119954 RepID=A0ACB9RR08_9MYRT|nr:hypothetical protein MLD38_015869 [Melastoma candidum]
MAIARTGVFVDDFSEYASALPTDIQRILNTIQELDGRSRSMLGQTAQQTAYCLTEEGKEDNVEAMGKLRKDIESTQDSALSLCTEKVLLAKQAYDLVDRLVKRLDEDLTQFAEDLKQDGKLPPEEPVILPPLPLVPRPEKRRISYGPPQSGRRNWERDSYRDSDYIPPRGDFGKDLSVMMEVDQFTDPNEPTYCICNQVSYGDMIACDNEDCEGQWFHYSCVGLTTETGFHGQWYCPTCRMLPQFQ